MEGAYLTKADSGIEEESSVGISGYGLGLRATFLKDLIVNVDVARALEGEGDIEQGDLRATGQLRYEF